MPRRRIVNNREESVRKGRYDSAEARASRQSLRAAERFDRADASNGISAPWENPELIDALDQLGGSGRDAQSTGFGRNLFNREQFRTWDPEVPYPQVDPSMTSNEDRPRTVAMGFDPNNEIVRVTFRENNAGINPVYEYYGVPEKVWAEFVSVESPGRFIDDVLTPQYAYRRKYELE